MAGWGPPTRREQKRDRAERARRAARQRRKDALNADVPRRMEILSRVKAGEITLAEAQRMIRKPHNTALRRGKDGAG